MTAKEGIKHGLVDGVEYHDQVLTKIGVNKDCPVQDMQKYWKEGDKADKNGKGGAGEPEKNFLEEVCIPHARGTTRLFC